MSPGQEGGLTTFSALKSEDSLTACILARRVPIAKHRMAWQIQACTGGMEDSPVVGLGGGGGIHDMHNIRHNNQLSCCIIFYDSGDK